MPLSIFFYGTIEGGLGWGNMKGSYLAGKEAYLRKFVGDDIQFVGNNTF